MKQVIDLDAVRTLIAARQQSQRVRDLADILENYFRLAPGRQLAHRLGFPRAATNRHALDLWIADKTSRVSDLSFDELATYLRHDLRELLSESAFYVDP